MSEQYAFAIGFDIDEAGHSPAELNEAGWQQLFQQVSLAIQTAGLPPVTSGRWDEFGAGRIFWGTKAECDAVRAVLDNFQVYVEEAQNLEPGFYATAAKTYVVQENGDIYVLPEDETAPNALPLKTATSIPMEAYRLRKVEESFTNRIGALLAQSAAIAATAEPDLDLANQVRSLQAELEQTQAIANGRIDPAQHDALKQKSAAQETHIQQLQGQIQALEGAIEQERQQSADPEQVRGLEQALAHKDEAVQQAAAARQELAEQLTAQTDSLQSAQGRVAELESDVQAKQARIDTLEQECSAKQSRIAELEGQYAQLATDRQQQTSSSEAQQQMIAELRQQIAAQALRQQSFQEATQRQKEELEANAQLMAEKVDLAEYQELQQAMAAKAAQIDELEQQLGVMERQCKEWQTTAESKVDPADYQALRAELQQLQEKQNRGLWARLFGD